MIRKYKDYITVIFSLFSLIIASLTFYLTRIKPFDLDVLAGPTMHFYYPSEGGAAFYLPVNFVNVSDKNGLIVKLYMRLEDPSGGVYYMRWKEFAEYFWRSDIFENLGDAEPFAIGSNSSEAKLIWFYWPNTEQQTMEFMSGDYKIGIYVWTENKEKYEILYTNNFNISDNTSKSLAKWKEVKSSATNYVYFSRQDKPVAFFSAGSDRHPWSSEP